MDKIVRRMRSADLASAFQRWRDYTAGLRHKGEVIERVVLRLAQLSQWSHHSTPHCVKIESSALCTDSVSTCKVEHGGTPIVQRTIGNCERWDRRGEKRAASLEHLLLFCIAMKVFQSVDDA